MRFHPPGPPSLPFAGPLIHFFQLQFPTVTPHTYICSPSLLILPWSTSSIYIKAERPNTSPAFLSKSVLPCHDVLCRNFSNAEGVGKMGGLLVKLCRSACSIFFCLLSFAAGSSPILLSFHTSSPLPPSLTQKIALCLIFIFQALCVCL